MMERRKCVRFAVPGATVSYQILRFPFRLFTSAEEGCPVFDLSKGGVALLTNRRLPSGRKISLLISISEGAEPMVLRGRIIHVGISQGVSYRYRVGVQFDAFGLGKGDNAPEVLKMLDGLEKTFWTAQPSPPRAAGEARLDAAVGMHARCCLGFLCGQML